MNNKSNTIQHPQRRVLVACSSSSPSIRGTSEPVRRTLRWRVRALVTISRWVRSSAAPGRVGHMVGLAWQQLALQPLQPQFRSNERYTPTHLLGRALYTLACEPPAHTHSSPASRSPRPRSPSSPRNWSTWLAHVVCSTGSNVVRIGQRLSCATSR